MPNRWWSKTIGDSEKAVELPILATNFFPIVVLAFLSSQGFSKIAALPSASPRLRREKWCFVTK